MASTIGRVETRHDGQLHEVQLDFYGRRLATAGHDGSVRVYDISNAEAPHEVYELKGHQAPVWSICWAHPKYPGVLASCGYDRQVMIWKDQGLAHKDEQARASVNQVRFAPVECGLVLAAAGSDGAVSIFEYKTTDSWTRTTFLAHPCGVRSLCWAPAGCVDLNGSTPLEGAKIATGGLDAAVKVWLFKNGSWVREDVDTSSGVGHKDWVTGVAWRPNGGQNSDIIASGSRDGSVILWQRFETIWRPIKLFKDEFAGKPIWSVEFSQVGGMLQVNFGESEMQIFKETGQGEFRPQIAIDERGVAPASGAPAPEVNLAAFGMDASSSGAEGGTVTPSILS
ncbi:unnamed protein product [Amoebophrya sp. A25]|nr:unnamed protein product [Amoebophrya sp. A25]|eukprot:GSA25T00000386001.1